MKIYSRAPVRIGLIGGGTDVNPFASDYGGKTLSLAISLHHNVCLEPVEEKKIYIQTLGKKIEKKLDEKLIYGKEKDFDLIYAIINNFKSDIKTGFKLKIVFDGKSSGGLGSSASAAVAIIGAFNYWLKRNLSRMEIAFLAWKIAVRELGWLAGKQDELAAAFGGINLLTFGPGEGVEVFPQKLPQDLIKKIRQWTVLFYIGGKRHSGDLQKKLSKGMSQEAKIKALKGLKAGVDKIIKALKKEDFNLVGKILDEAWELKKKSNPAIATGRINNIYNLAKKSGAFGGKVMGAGSAGHMFFFCPPEKQAGLIKVLKKEEVKVVDFDFDFEGLKVKVEK